MEENNENEIKENLIDNKISQTENDENNLNSNLKEENDNINQKEDQDINLEVKNNNNYYQDLMEKIVPNNNDLNKSFGQVIEDDIKRNETAEYMNLKKKKTEDENDDKNEDDNLKIKNKGKTKFRFHLKINKKLLRYSTLVIIILYIIITIISCVSFHYRRADHPFLFCFKFIARDPGVNQDLKENEIIYFLTDLNSFYILHVVLLVIFVSICFLLIRGTQSEINHFFDNMSIFFMSTLIFNIPILFNGMFTEYFYGSHLQSSVYLGLTLLSFLCMGKIYLVTKSHEYKSVSSFINISVLSSFMAAYQCYCFLFNVSYFIMNFYKPHVDSDNEYPGIEITFSSIYFVIGIIIITVYKDIFFNVAMVNMEIGLLYSKRKSDFSLLTAIVNISILSLNYASIIIVIFAFNKKVFRLKEKKK